MMCEGEAGLLLKRTKADFLSGRTHEDAMVFL